MAETPVTQAQFAAWTGSADYRRWFRKFGKANCTNGKEHANYFPGKPDHPAERVTWHEATAFTA